MVEVCVATNNVIPANNVIMLAILHVKQAKIQIQMLNLSLLVLLMV